jgi:hypothetical protein
MIAKRGRPNVTLKETRGTIAQRRYLQISADDTGKALLQVKWSSCSMGL